MEDEDENEDEDEDDMSPAGFRQTLMRAQARAGLVAAVAPTRSAHYSR